MTTRKKTSFQPPSTELIVSRQEFKNTLQDRIQQGKDLLDQEIRTQADFDENRKKYHLWDDYNSEYLKQSFNNELNEYKSSYDQCADWVGFVGIRTRPESVQEKLANHKTKIEKKFDNLEKLYSKTDLLKSSIQSDPTSLPSEIELSHNIFIVHGHDDRAKLDVARTVTQIGLNPVILSEQANQGQTVIEKFEFHSNVGFAIIILTCDDLGKGKSESEEKYRARQNVILEMGYFIGKLGRAKVFPLYESGVELPSDLHGIVYVPLDGAGAWKLKLGQELKTAGYEIDMNKLII